VSMASPSWPFLGKTLMPMLAVTDSTVAGNG
jgi:hypothetical protein